MLYSYLKEKLLSLFDSDKLKQTPHEWGFFNEEEKNVLRIGYATNLTPDVIKHAIDNKTDMILTHHDAWDFIYGMKPVCQKLLKDNKLIHAFFHAPLDDAAFGTSHSLAKALSLGHLIPAIPYEDVYFAGVVGEFAAAVPFDELGFILTNILGEELRSYQNNDRLIKKVCVTTGGGHLTAFLKEANENGCDAYITGEYSLYTQQYADFTGLNLFVGSHTNTEILGVKNLADAVASDTDIEVVRLLENNY